MKKSEVRSELTGTGDCFQLPPPSIDTRMCPRGPAATILSPARVTAWSIDFDASGDMIAGASSTSTKPAARPATGNASSVAAANTLNERRWQLFIRSSAELMRPDSPREGDRARGRDSRLLRLELSAPR